MRVLGLVVALVLSSAAAGAALAGRSSAQVPVDELVGQRLLVAMRGTAPDAGMLARVREGHVGGVILFGGNVRSAPQVRALVARLQQAAREGGQPPLLVAVDQEGGSTRRFRWAPPARSAADLGRRGATEASLAGRATARALRALGVNVDLAPVVDVPSVEGSFIAAQRRAFGTDPAAVGKLAAAFAAGLRSGGVLATAKHFPGLGRAVRSTDTAPVTIAAARAALESDLEPYRLLIAQGVPLVMVANAAYPALDGKPGAWSPGVQALLRRSLGFEGVTITDALDAVAATQHRPLPAVAVLAAQSGADLLLVAGSEAVSDAVYARLLRAAEDGRLPPASLARSYERILSLKRVL